MTIKKKKTIAFLILTAFILFGLSACGERKDEDGNKETAVTEADNAVARENGISDDGGNSDNLHQNREQSINNLKVRTGIYTKTLYMEALGNNGDLANENPIATLISPALQIVSGKYDLDGDYNEKEDPYLNLRENVNSYFFENIEKRISNMEEMKSQCEEMLEYNPDAFKYMSMYDEERLKILRADENILSFMISAYSFYMGAHPYGGYEGAAFDTATGKRLLIGDIFTDTEGLSELLIGRIMELSPERDIESVKNAFYDPEYGYSLDNYANLAFALDYEGVRFLFGDYALGTYAEGSQIVHILYDELEGMIDERFTRVPDAFFMDLDLIEGISVDIDFDGKRERITWAEGIYDREHPEIITGLKICIGDDGREKEQEYELGFKGDGRDYLQPLLLKTKDGSYGICYTGADVTTGLEYIQIFPLGEESTIKEALIRGGYAVDYVPFGDYMQKTYSPWIGNETEDKQYNFFEGRDVFTDPYDFRVMTLTALVSNVYVTAPYSIDESGKTLRQEDYSYILPGFESWCDLISGEDITGDIVERHTWKILKKDAVIPAGSNLYTTYTDNETYIIVWNEEDGNYYRIAVEKNTDGTVLINGLEPDEVFSMRDILYGMTEK